MTQFNNVGKPSHTNSPIPPEIVERSSFENPEIIQYSLAPSVKELGLHLKNWKESRTATLGKRKVDLRMGGGRRDGATNALTKTAILTRAHSFKSPRNPACQIHAKVKRAS